MTKSLYEILRRLRGKISYNVMNHLLVVNIVPEAWQFLVLAYQQKPAEVLQVLALIAQPKEKTHDLP